MNPASPVEDEPQPATALYIHVPFCLSVCPYCDFVVYGGRPARRGPRGLIEPLVAALDAEIRLRGEAARLAFGPLPPVESVYIGGGTPSLLTASEVGRLLTATREVFGLAADAEVTLEVNPGPADRGDLRGFRAAGVNRLSVGVQSMVDRELRALGRRHSGGDVVATLREARDAGFENISADLLYDVPTQTLPSWRRTVEAVLALEPDHVSAYSLTLERDDTPAPDRTPGRAGAQRWRARAVGEQDEDRAAAQYRLVDRLLGVAGFEWYEISNWARPGRQSRHNVAYWWSLPHEAVGPGAHAFDGRARRWNAARVDAYLEALTPPDRGQPSLPPGGTEVPDPIATGAERAILRLRTRDGLDASTAAQADFAPAIAWGRTHGLLAEGRAGSVRLTMRGRLLANEVFARLLPEPGARAALEAA